MGVLWRVYVPPPNRLPGLCAVSVSFHWEQLPVARGGSNSVETRPLTVGMSVLRHRPGHRLGQHNAATLISSAPLLVAFVLFQRQFVQSFLRAGIR